MSEPIPIRMPKWGLSMQEGAIVGWLKREGESVAEGEELVEVETSKITNVYESPASGVLRAIAVPEGETVPVGSLIAVLADADADAAEIAAFVEAQKAAPPVVEEDAGALALSTVEADGRSIRVGRAGEGEATPVVLIHGFSGDLENWLFTIPALAADRPVIALDLPGHGGSDKDVGDGSRGRAWRKPSGPRSMTLGVTRAHLVGHSLGRRGGGEARGGSARLAREPHPDRARAHAGRGAEPRLPGRHGRRRARPRAEAADGDAVRRSGGGVRRHGRGHAPLQAHRRRARSSGRYPRPHGRGRRRQGRAGGARALGPVLVIASKTDQIVGAPDEAALPANVRVVWIEGAGHMPHLEKAAEVDGLLQEQVS